MKRTIMKSIALAVLVNMNSMSFAEDAPPQWRLDYLAVAEQTLRDSFDGDFPEETYQWLAINDLGNSLLQAVGPDAEILRNIDEIRHALPVDVAEKYQNMIFGIAVARRLDGIGSVTYNSNRFGKLRTKTEPTAKDLQKQVEQQAVVDALLPLMAEKQWDSTLAFEHYAEVIEYLQGKVELQALKYVKFATDVNIAANLYAYNLSTGIIQTRDANASAAEYIEHIASIQDLQVSPFMGKNEYFSWAAIFPYDAPWPLQMPLAEARPVSEMEYIWDRFADESASANQRVRKYGNYRNSAATAPYIATVEYPKSSLQYVNYVGGVCGTMSQVGRGSYISLGIPSLAAGQPGHALLMRYTYNADNGTYLAKMEQSIASLFDTTPDWHFFEDNSYRISTNGRVSRGEYPLGLSIAMNGNLQDYLDSRTKVRMAEAALDTQDMLKKRLLRNAANYSPFNAEVWYDWFDARGADVDVAIKLIANIRGKLPSINDGLYESLLANEEQDLVELAIKPSSLESSVATYRDTIIAGLLQKAFANEAVLPEGYADFIRLENNDNNYDLSRYYSYDAFYAANMTSEKLVFDKARLAEFDRQKLIATLTLEIASGELPQWRIDNKTLKIAKLEVESELYWAGL